ncbi:MAG: Uncharacterised protein [Flavobacterium sp. SCGC AAA160-P02]|nr:MAG: Uncharacterised protein [Flavobacterium sp. SCGC AAA160-P02]|tara:strand:+ start:2833 stop:3459 length:627 start_codon:yes stop_codon:yes gene_type:complete
MPLYKTIHVNQFTNVLIWDIQESLEVLSHQIELTENSQNRINSMKSEVHQRGFLSIRHLLIKVGYSDADLYYDEFGKPYLKDGNYISISHSFRFSAIAISKKDPVGIDIEKQRDKIIKIGHKFTPIDAYKNIIDQDSLVRKLTIVWGAKESLYKIYGKRQLRFLEHIDIKDFDLVSNKTIGMINHENFTSNHSIEFLELEGYTCVYAF